MISILTLLALVSREEAKNRNKILQFSTAQQETIQCLKKSALRKV